MPSDGPTLTLQGLTKVSDNLLQLVATLPAAAARALNVVAEETMTDAKQRTPVDTGTLRRSGKVHQPATPDVLSAGLSFGTDYAVYVHERTNLRHANGEAKFLEHAVQFTARYYEDRIANEMHFGEQGVTGNTNPGGGGDVL